MNGQLTFEQACEILGKDPNLLPDTTGANPKSAARAIANYKLEVIHMAIVGDWEPDFSDLSEEKWTGWLWFNPSRGAFDFSGTDYALAITYLGARFWFPDETTARDFTITNADLINDLHNHRK
jgi:hypothetical protein